MEAVSAVRLVLLGLDAEEWPDGSFGGARTVRGTPSTPVRTPRPDPAAAEHVAVLVAALHRRRKADAA
ncbi:hypothetical protein ACIBJC_15145 [Streptomyces sp. NPDC050509]|uniref:hypothetical protein n=1 Tax=Streptomyces sp. NPDC050509 TaxID=3365620 RepID=UPI0037AA588B